jgi:hypothetical protein
LLVCFNDFDWVGDLDDQNYTTGYIFSLGFRLVTWACKKQHALDFYLGEVEYQETINRNSRIILDLVDPFRV